MRNRIFTSVLLPSLIIIAGFAGIVVIGEFISRRRPQLSAEFTDADLSMNGSRLKGFLFGMEGLLADWYWIRSLQYIGGKMLLYKGSNDINLDDLRPLNPRLLYPLLENTTTLDPHFIEAYSYGAIVLPAIDSEKAIELAEKGIEKNPREWRLYHQLGYIYWTRGRYDEAAEVYGRGAAIPDASSFLHLMAAAMKTKGGSRSTAREIYRQMYAESADNAVKITAERRLMELDYLEQREVIDEALSKIREQSGRCVVSLVEIYPLLAQVKMEAGNSFRVDASKRIIDPNGVPYLLDKENCRVKLDNKQTGLGVR